MKANKDTLLSFFPGDESVINEFILVNKDIDYQTVDSMVYAYEDYFESLNLTYIEDEC